MNKLYKPFLTQAYLRTGFIPVLPFIKQILPGDFFQICGGHIRILGNLFKDHVLEPKDVTMEYGRDQNPEDWKFSMGETEPYFGRKQISSQRAEAEMDIKRFALEAPGSFFFEARNPRSVAITNWYEIDDQLTIKLSQIRYSFREVYVVTETAYLDHWVFALANDHKAKLELKITLSESGAMEFFGTAETRAVKAKNIEMYRRQDKPEVPFFKAKLLSSRNQRDPLVNSLTLLQPRSSVRWPHEVFSFDFSLEDHQQQSRYQGISLLDGLRANELNPNTALEYFHWTDANLDDIERLFTGE